MHRVYRYRLYPTRGQREALDGQLRGACDLYNAALEQRRETYNRFGVSVGYHQQSAELREIRAAGLLDATANFWSQQAVLRQLDRAFTAFFRRVSRDEKAGYPRHKSASRFDTLTWTCKGNAGGVAVTDRGRLRLQGIGHVKVSWHRPLPAAAVLGEVKVTRRSGGRDGVRYYVSFCCELPDRERTHPTGEAVGLDLGVRQLVSLSIGEQIPGPRAQAQAAAAVRRAARKVARRKRSSNRRHKAAVLLARHREREANQRRDHAHKLSRRLADRYALIAVENLRVRKMVRSAAGTVDDPGTQVAQKRGLNRAISDQGWAQFLNLLAYKAEEAGGRVIKVNPVNTSRICAACGHVDAGSRNAERFRCVACSHTDNADVNAAKTILSRALAKDGIDRPGWGRQAKTAALAAVA